MFWSSMFGLQISQLCHSVSNGIKCLFWLQTWVCSHNYTLKCAFLSLELNKALCYRSLGQKTLDFSGENRLCCFFFTVQVTEHWHRSPSLAVVGSPSMEIFKIHLIWYWATWSELEQMASIGAFQLNHFVILWQFSSGRQVMHSRKYCPNLLILTPNRLIEC